MAFPAHNQRHRDPQYPYGATAAPPPTPSAQPNPVASSDASDVLSRLLLRLPPTLSLPTRRFPPPPTTIAAAPPLLSLSPHNTNFPTELLAASSQLGYFQFTTHSIPSQLAHAAESESLSLFALPREQKQIYFPKNWPMGFDCDEDGDEDDDEGKNGSFCFNASVFPESTGSSLASLGEFTREMEKVGLEVVEALSCAVGFENPVREDPTRVCSLMWIYGGAPSNEPVVTGKFYPYVVGLQYQIRCGRYTFLADSGWVSVSPRIDSILVTLGDIAQVWSNGKTKKVRGTPVNIPTNDDAKNARCVTMSLLVTLPLESVVSPLFSPAIAAGGREDDDEANSGGGGGGGGSSADTRDRQDMAFRFSSFSFEDYAWRVYHHERLLLKDPLDRYRI